MKQIEFGMDRLYSDFNNCGFFKKFEIIDKKEENDLINRETRYKRRTMLPFI